MTGTVLMESDRELEYNYTWRGHAPRNDQENFQEAAKSLVAHLNGMANISAFDASTGSNVERTLSNKYEQIGKLIRNRTAFVDSKSKTSSFSATQRGLIVSVEAKRWKPGTYYNEYKRDKWTGERNSKAGGALLYTFVVYAPEGYAPTERSQGERSERRVRDDDVDPRRNRPSRRRGRG